jgi:hypothetical protein
MMCILSGIRDAITRPKLISAVREAAGTQEAEAMGLVRREPTFKTAAPEPTSTPEAAAALSAVELARTVVAMATAPKAAARRAAARKGSGTQEQRDATDGAGIGAGPAGTDSTEGRPSGPTKRKIIHYGT